MAYKQVIIIQKQKIKSKQELIRDAALCSLKAAEKTKQKHPSIFKKWMKYGQKKVTVRLENKENIQSIINLCENKSICWACTNHNPHEMDLLNCYLYVLGPHLESKLDPLTGQLKLL